MAQHSPEPDRSGRSLRSMIAAFWPPLPVWRRLDASVVLVASYTALVTLVVAYSDLHIPEWGGASTILNALVLGVLLAFRNKEAYERWWEGRKLWGQLVNDSRNLCLKAAALPGFSDSARQNLRRLVIGFAVALKDRLRGDARLQSVPGFEAEKVEPSHVPLYLSGQVFTLLQAERTAGRITELDLVVLDPHARALMDICGACERIKSTPIPLSYRSLLRHGLVLYLLSTPWLIADQLAWWGVAVTALLAYFLLGVEATAEDVEDPFGRDGDDLKLSAYCETIRRSAEEAIK